MAPEAERLTGVASRVPVEWARCEPLEGKLDEASFAHYAAVLDGCHARGLVPVVVLHHLVHPRWLGDDYWLRLEAPARFEAWAGTVVARLGARCRHWVTVDEPNVAAVRSWLSGTSAPGRILAVGDLVRSLDHMLAAHVVASRTLAGHRADAAVTTTVAATPLYELAPLLTDVLAARDAGVERYQLHDWLGARRRAWYAARARPSPVEAAVRRLARSAIPLEQALPRTLDAVWAGPHGRPRHDLGVDLPPRLDGSAEAGPAPSPGTHPLLATVGRAVESAVLGPEVYVTAGPRVATAGRAASPS